MESRSYKFGELRQRIQESASEFKPKYGVGFSKSREESDSREAYRNIDANVKSLNGKALNSKSKNEGQSQLADVNLGMSDLQYDGEVSQSFKDRAKAGMEGYTSSLSKKNHSKESLGNAYRDDRIAKKCIQKAKDVKSMQDAQSEIGITNSQKKPEDTHRHKTNIGESKKTSILKFKHVQFISESQMLAHVPDEYKNEGKRFYMQDCKGNKYLVEWHEKPEIEKMLNEEKTAAEMARIKDLFGYKPGNSKTTNSLRMNEDTKINDMLSRVRELMN